MLQNSSGTEAGLSDFHKMVVWKINTSFRKLQPNIVVIGKIKNFQMNILGKI